ncbi:DUF4245 domain-containing protein [Nocardiopsis nanhaiensis]
MSSYSRANATFKNYAISLGIVVGILLLMAFVVSTRSDENIPAVEYRPDVEVLRDAADYPVVAPEGLPEGWVPTSSTLDVTGPTEWSLGFATPEDSHAMLTQSDGEPDDVVADRAQDADPVGTVMVAGEEWEHLEGEDWSLIVLREEDRTLVVSGSTTLDEFAVLAGHLETLPVQDAEDADEDSEDGSGGGAEDAEGADEEAEQEADEEDTDS